MSEVDFKALKQANVYLRLDHAGVLEKKSEKEYSFTYLNSYLEKKDSLSIARSLKKQKDSFVSQKLHPFFDNLISEGWLLQTTEKVFHIDKANRFALLMATGQSPIGAVTVRSIGVDGAEIDVIKEFQNELESETLRAFPSLQPKNFPYCTTCFVDLKEGQQHRKCAIEMWETERALKIQMDEQNPISSFARVIYGGSVSGAQKKGMFRLDPKSGVLAATPSGAQYILKPDGDYPELPQNEHVTMAIARAVGFRVPPFALLEIEKLGYVFAIKRFDISSNNIPLMMEDMGQLIEVPSLDKYESSFEKVVAAIAAHSSAPKIDTQDFYRRLIFCYFIANADMHLKNWTLVENQRALGSFMLSPCYDLLNTRVPLPREKIDIGLKMNGKDRNLQASYFRSFGKQIGISEKKIEEIFSELDNWLEVATEFVGKSLLTPKAKLAYLALVKDRHKILKAKP
jgi:serine/threonine-protein kinase HipA